jgi:hypothetical protein
MPDTADDLRQQLAQLQAGRDGGDVREKDFQRRVAEASLALSRVVVERGLPPGERIITEHHVIHSHFRLTQSLVKEPEQATVSLFACEGRLVRVRGNLRPGRPVTCDEADGTQVDQLGYARVHGLVRRVEWRWGEMGVGGMVLLVAWLGGGLLSVTGPLLALLGLAGLLHGLLVPTRWIEITTLDVPTAPPFLVHGLRRRSARKLLRVVRERISAPVARPAGQPQEP